MEISKQCCSLEQAKRLKELGVKQDSIAVWFNSSVGLCLLYRTSDFTFENEWAAFTVAELGEMLPHSPLPNTGNSWNWYHRYCWKGHSVGYTAYGQEPIQQDWFATEAQARAAMLIYLLENKLI